MLTAKCLKNILITILIVISLTLLAASIVWTVELFMPWWLNRSKIYDFFKYFIFILTFVFLLFNLYPLVKRFKFIKKQYLENGNKICFTKIIMFVIRTLVCFSILVILFLFMQNVQDFGNITTLFFQNKTTFIIFDILLIASIILISFDFKQIKVGVK
ncbi:MAG: hypothetical protein HDR43_00725 [Mycoplasma sp.]|nr:hypothetical protein [Mycoplasma sp.]